MKKFLACFAIFLSAAMSFAQKLEIAVEKGEFWGNPQFAIWAETADGKFIKTLRSSMRAAEKKWRLAPKEGRPEALPVWEARKKGEADAQSGATPRADFSLEFESGGEVVIFAEFNNSFDYNDFWTKKNSGVNGQPSVVYKAVFSASDDEKELLFCGCGDVSGQDGKIHEAKNLDTALQIVKKICVLRDAICF